MRMQNCLPLRYLDMQDLVLSGRASDVHFRFTPNTGASRVYYANDMAMIDQESDRTRSRGYAGAFEVPVTDITVTATHADTGKELASGTLPVRAGTIGYMYLVPAPMR
jgi:hypothetical protein